MLQNVALVVLDRFPSFEFGVVCEVFGVDRTDDCLPGYDFAVVAGQDGPLRSEHGLTLGAAYGIERLEAADLVIVSAIGAQLREGVPVGLPAPLLAALRAAAARGSRVLSVCTGAFVLAAAGLLDGRRCTTHWMYAADLARYSRGATVDPDVLYVDADPVITSAGSAAGIDACLYLVRKEQGMKVANQIARRFVQETGTTPLRWLTGQRILLAQRLLEDTGQSVDQVAARTGFGNPVALRHHFRAWRGTTPAAYRSSFRAGVRRAASRRSARTA